MSTETNTEPWPFKPGDVVDDTEGAEQEWLMVAPKGTVLIDADGERFTRTNGRWSAHGGSWLMVSEVLAERGPLTVEAVPSHAARPAAQDAPAAPRVGVGTSDAANGAQGGAGGLGDAIRAEANDLHHMGKVVRLDHLADRADMLERDREGLRIRAELAEETVRLQKEAIERVHRQANRLAKHPAIAVRHAGDSILRELDGAQ